MKLTLNNYSHIHTLQLYAERTIHYESEKVEEHEHDFHELVIVQKGSGCHVIDNHSFNVSAGDFFVVFPGHQHYYMNMEHLTLMNILFNPVIFDFFKSDLLRMPGFQVMFNAQIENSPSRKKCEKMNIDEETISAVMRIFNQILDEQNNLQSGSSTFILTSFIQLVLLICRKSYPSDGRYSSHSYQISKAINYMEKNYQNKISLEILAEVSGLSGSSFRRCFHDTIGISPINYLLKLRLEKATILLDTSDLSISEIAYKTGFSDSNYFIRQFKNFTGTTPLKYRAGNHGIFYIPKH